MRLWISPVISMPSSILGSRATSGTSVRNYRNSSATLIGVPKDRFAALEVTQALHQPQHTSGKCAAKRNCSWWHMADKNILLIEPGYKNKYPPLGLMKIAQYHGPRGKRDNVVFIKGEDSKIFSKAWDRIYVTTLFSFEFAKISQSIDFALKAANGDADRVFVGGIAASLMHERFVQEPRWSGVRFIQGLLDRAPAISLQLDEFSDDLY